MIASSQGSSRQLVEVVSSERKGILTDIKEKTESLDIRMVLLAIIFTCYCILLLFDVNICLSPKLTFW